jgi:hypothetical protein
MDKTVKVSLQLLWVAGTAGLLAACAAGGDAPAKDVPPILQPPSDERQAFSYAARGVQIYECKVGASGTPAWAFVAPEAELFDASGSDIVHHDVGPTWHHHDGSEVVGSLKQRADAPQPGAIPWLLLSAKSTGGAGMMATVTFVQRIHTQGGVAPPQGCGTSGDVGAQARVPYTADYVFFVAK